MKQRNPFADLDGLPNLKVQTYKCGARAGARKLSRNAANDLITEKMSLLETPSELAAFAAAFGVPRERIIELAETSARFGQFRMHMGNLARGVLRRYNFALKNPKLRGKIEIADCATRERFKAKRRAIREASNSRECSFSVPC
jgi:hypothetical protein